MSVVSRMLVRTIVETLLIVAGWALVVAAVVVAVTGHLAVAGVLFVGAVIAFFLHARSLKSKPSSEYVRELQGGRR